MPKERKPRMPDPMQFAIALVEGITGEKLVERPEVPAAGFSLFPLLTSRPPDSLG